MNQREEAESYTAEFKGSAVKLALESKGSPAQTARELSVIYSWVRQYHGRPQPDLEAVNSEHIYEELKRLRREVSSLQEERDILVKAAACFVKHAK